MIKAVLQVLLPCCILASCNFKKPQFSEWVSTIETSAIDTTTYVATFTSNALSIDTIYRSMQGPFEVKNIQIASDEDLVWITAYESRLEEEGTNAELASKYMCHNNLNYSNTKSIPWERNTSQKNSRIFTLSEGQTSLQFPKGFGVPILTSQSLQMVSQVLNHHEPQIDKKIHHKVSIHYKNGNNPKMKALYQQPIFITKQLSGPSGSYGLSHLCTNHHIDSSATFGDTTLHHCAVDIDTEDYNPYEDKYGRKYSGHWKLTYGSEELVTNVSSMLNLKDSNRIHLIGVHLHPFARDFKLIDITNDQLLYQAEIKRDSLQFGFEKIGYYKSEEGIAVFPDHQYELRCTYNCTDSLNEHTAMAVMYLFLEE